MPGCRLPRAVTVTDRNVKGGSLLQLAPMIWVRRAGSRQLFVATDRP